MEDYSVERMLVLRKLTRAVADLLRGEMKEYLATLSPLLRPKSVLGEYIQSSAREVVPGAERAFADLQDQFEAIAGTAPLNLSRDLKPPIELLSATLEISPLEYTYEAKTEGARKIVTVTSPLEWVVTYSGFAPGRLKELLADRDRSQDELRQFAVHYLVMHTVIRNQPGVGRILEGLQFPLRAAPSPEYGNLPVAVISSPVSTILPEDSVIIETTEVSGTDAFEEVVNLEDIAALRNPLKERLAALVESQGERLSL